jgi:epoxyqueuosine reductase
MKKKLNKFQLTQLIRQAAQRIGFVDCGFSEVRSLTGHKQHYLDWIERGHQAGMEYMTRNIDQRLNPALLMDGAKTVISLLYNYYTSEKLEGSPLQIAKYAFGEDYHNAINEKLKQLDQFIGDLTDTVIQRSYVDTGPVLEKVWASNSGLGWIGKNSSLISRRHGSFVFIADIITSLELEYDKPLKDYCGSCRKCIEACPTSAIMDNRTIDSRQCISYQTIENRDDIPVTLKGKFHNYIFGCDICQDVCPWNKKSHSHTEALFSLNPEIRHMTLSDWENLDEKTFQHFFHKSAVKRAKFEGLKRNIDFVTLKVKG